jgi:hypothetical protein
MIMRLLRKVFSPFIAVFLGFTAPVLVGLYLAALFSLPRLPVMLLVFVATVFLFLDLVKSYDKK